MKINSWGDIVVIVLMALFVLFVVYAIWTGIKQTVREIRCKHSGGHEWEREIDPFNWGQKPERMYHCKRCGKGKIE